MNADTSAMSRSMKACMFRITAALNTGHFVMGRQASIELPKGVEWPKACKASNMQNIFQWCTAKLMMLA